MSESLLRVLEHARRNQGMVTRAEAIALGIPAKTLDRRIQEGVLTRVNSRVLSLPGYVEGDLATLAAATKALNAVISHESAAWIHGMPIGTHPHPVVSVAIRRSNRFPNVLVHQLTDLTPDHVAQIDHLPITTPTRTIVDLASCIGVLRLTRCLDHVLSSGLAGLDDLNQTFNSLARKGKPGVAKLRSVLTSRQALSAIPESVLETETLALLELADVGQPELQWRPPWLRQVNGRVDFAYPKHRLIVEADSRRWHNTPAAFQLDRNRDNLAQLAGWRILRFTWTDVTTRPEYVVDSVRSAIFTQRADF